jgi:alkyl sulfatase BDS1-like metallo-beta-lactamase superfamily hydrolase
MINQGKSVEELVEAIRLPKHITELHQLFPGYVDEEYNVRGQYRGLVGWFGEEIADLYPPKAKEIGQTVIELAGGTDNVMAKAKEAIDEKKYNLAVTLTTYVLSAEPEHKAAKQLKADTLRHMAYTTRTGIQARNYFLTHALHLEGKVDINAAPAFNIFGAEDPESVMASDVGSSIEALEYRIDPLKSANIDKVVTITFAETNQSWEIHVRRGVAEILPYNKGKVNANLVVPRQQWVEMVAGDAKLSDLLKSDSVKVNGNEAVLKEVLTSFDNIDS